MPQFKLNGKAYSGSTNYASAINYTEEDGNKTTVQNKINNIDSKEINYHTLNPSDTSASTTEKTVETLDGRKFSDYSLITFALRVTGYIRNSITVPTIHFKDAAGVSITYIDTSNILRYVDVKYVSDTSYTVICSSNYDDVVPYVTVIGHKLY